MENSTLYWIIGIVVVFILIYILIFNGIKRSQIKIDEGMSGIDVALSKRYNVLKNSSSTVKGYANYEKETLENLIEVRNTMSVSEKEKCAGIYSDAEKKLFALAESYPDLKASTNFLELQKQIADCEEHLQAARRFYNSNVTDYNNRILTFPGFLVASGMHAEKAPFFQADASETSNVEMKF